MNDLILKLALKELNKSISIEEDILLKKWISESSQNKQEYKNIMHAFLIAKDIDILKKINKEKAWSQIDEKTEIKRSKLLSLNRKLKYAAAILIPVLFGSILFYYMQFNKKTAEPDTFAQLEAIRPGTNKAFLTLSNGKTITLNNDLQSKVLLKNNLLEIKDSINTIVYKNTAPNNIPQNNKVTVPIGGEYKVILSDGTAVWLNSDTKFEFPVEFIGEQRNVVLEGEAYFEVAKNESKPFIVKTNGIEIKVLGTSFNVSAYKDDHSITTTLLEGKVRIISSSEEIDMEPGYQSEFKNNKLKLKKVDAEMYAQWKDGIFRFKNIRLEDLTKKLSRWYDVNFQFENNKLKNSLFNGAAKKDKPLSIILKILEVTNHISYEVHNDTISIKNNN